MDGFPASAPRVLEPIPRVGFVTTNNVRENNSLHAERSTFAIQMMEVHQRSKCQTPPGALPSIWNAIMPYWSTINHHQQQQQEQRQLNIDGTAVVHDEITRRPETDKSWALHAGEIAARAADESFSDVRRQQHFLPGELASAPLAREDYRVPDPADMRRVTIWNATEQRKLSGNAAPFKKNLDSYLALHPDWELYTGQDQQMPAKKRKRKSESTRAPAAETPASQESNRSNDPMASLLWAAEQ